MSEDLSPEHRKLEGNREYEAALDALFARPGRKLRIFERQLGAAYNGPSATICCAVFCLRAARVRFRSCYTTLPIFSATVHG